MGVPPVVLAVTRALEEVAGDVDAPGLLEVEGWRLEDDNGSRAVPRVMEAEAEIRNPNPHPQPPENVHTCTLMRSPHSHLHPHVLLHLCRVSEGVVVRVEVELRAGGGPVEPSVVHLCEQGGGGGGAWYEGNASPSRGESFSQ